MKGLLILGSFLVLANAQYPNSQYGAPQRASPPLATGGYPGGGGGGYPGSQGGYPSSQGSYPGSQGGYPAPGGPSAPEEDEEPIKVVRHVFVHVAPDDESSGIARVIKAPIPRERQVSILFVKAPAPAAPDQQIVDIPNDGGKKTLVYVLLKKADATPDVGFKTPPPTQPSKPEIYFIRYKDGKKPGAPGAQPEYGAPAAAPEAPAQPQYGAPAPAAPAAKYTAPAAPATQYGSPEAAPGGYQKK